MPTFLPRALWFGLVASAALLAACGSPSSLSSAARSSSSSDFVARPDATRHDISGKVMKVDAAQRKVTLAHESIPNYMGAMTMEFAVKEAWAFQALAPGDRLSGTLVVDGARTWIEGVSVSKTPSASTVPAGAWTPPAPGTPLPDVALVDQDAKPLAWARFRGQPLVLTFIYTRCPLPDYCPLMMQRFAALEKATAADPALANVRLLAITVDPKYDTPAILRAFGDRYKRSPRWTLATGEPADIKRLAAFFGLDYFEEDGQIMHALRTAIVDSQGGVYKMFEGNSWTVDQILGELKTLPPSAPAPTAAVPTKSGPAAP